MSTRKDIHIRECSEMDDNKEIGTKKKRRYEEHCYDGEHHKSEQGSSIVHGHNDSGTSKHRELFTIYPDPQTGLIDKKEFLSKYGTYQVIYLPQICSYIKCNNKEEEEEEKGNVNSSSLHKNHVKKVPFTVASFIIKNFSQHFIIFILLASFAQSFRLSYP